MRITMLAAAGAVMLASTIGSVSAADEFTTLKGVKAFLMSAGELSAVKGMDHHFNVTPPGTGVLVRHDTDKKQDADGGGNFITIIRADNGKEMKVAPSYNGLAKACAANNVISMPGFINCN